MRFDEFFTLHEHATASAARVKHSALVGLQHFYEKLHNAFRCVELSALLAFSQGKFTKEIFKDPTKNIFALGFLCPQYGRTDKVHQSAQTAFVQFFLSV